MKMLQRLLKPRSWKCICDDLMMIQYHTHLQTQLVLDSTVSGVKKWKPFIPKRFASENLQIPISFHVKTQDEFTSRVLHAQIPIIVQFGAEWCEHTQHIAYLLDEEISNHRGRLMAARVDVDYCGDLVYQYKVFSLPMLILFKKGNHVESLEGAMEDETIKNFVDKALKLQ